jgi:LPPG:FO 2-phospho-L-lactate transferase
VTYWLAGLADRDRGWGRANETFRATEELRRLGSDDSWFGLGDLDLAVHLFRTSRLAAGRPLSHVCRELASRLGIRTRIVPMTDDPVETRIQAVDENGSGYVAHFQVYWVARGGRDQVKGVQFAGVERARPAPGVIEAIEEADAVLVCPSNPVVSVDPILAVPGIRSAVASRRLSAAGISPIVGGAPLRGMADRLLPAIGVEVSAAGVAEHYADVLSAWVIDRRDEVQAPRIAGMGLRTRVTDTIMVDDEAAESLAREVLAAATGEPPP